MKAIDPVCNMTIEDKDAVATSIYKGGTYHFCAKSCKDDFDKNPEEFTGHSDTTSFPKESVKLLGSFTSPLQYKNLHINNHEAKEGSR